MRSGQEESLMLSRITNSKSNVEDAFDIKGICIKRMSDGTYYDVELGVPVPEEAVSEYIT